MASFLDMAELKQAAQPKNFDVTNMNVNGGPSNREIGVTIHTLFL